MSDGHLGIKKAIEYIYILILNIYYVDGTFYLT
jgi:hypothetical protein